MRVVMISKALVVGAYQRKCEEIAAHPDIELTVLVPPRWTDKGRATSLERTYTRGYDLRVIPLLFDGHFHLHLYPTLGRELSMLRPDVLHVDEEPYNLATFLAYLHGGRVGARRLFFTWQNIFRRLPPPINWMERWVLSQSVAAIAGNTAARDILRQKGFKKSVEVIPQVGFDPELFQPPTSRPERPFTIGFVGRLIEEKGLLDLVTAVDGLTGDWRLIFVGDGPLRSALAARAMALNVGDRVVFQAPVPSTDVPRALHQLDCLVLPSRTTPSWKEQFGRILVEAMACGVAVVGSSSGEIPQVVGSAGLVFPEGDAAALRDRLQQLISSRSLMRDFQSLGRQRFLDQFTQKQIANATVDMYRRLLTTQ